MKTIINAVNAPKPAGPYSQAVKAGKFLFISGQLAIDPIEGKIIASDIKAQTARVMENIKAILEAADYSLGDIVQTNVYLSSMMLFRDFNSTYAGYFDKDYPARATVGAELMCGAFVEIGGSVQGITVELSHLARQAQSEQSASLSGEDVINFKRSPPQNKPDEV